MVPWISQAHARVGPVVLHTCWINGADVATSELAEFGIPVPFEQMRRAQLEGAKLDMLRPFGDGFIVTIHNLRLGEVEEQPDDESPLPAMSGGVDPAELSLEPDVEDPLDAEDVERSATPDSVPVEPWNQTSPTDSKKQHKGYNPSSYLGNSP